MSDPRSLSCLVSEVSLLTLLPVPCSRPFNAIGMPYYRDTLLSAWPPTVSEVGAPPVKFEPQFLDTLAHADFGLYGHNSRGLRRNQLEKTRKAEKSIAPGIQAPKFLSEKARESANASGAPPSEDRAEDAITNFASTSSSEVPVMYRNVEIKYSKFGVDDFDFGYAFILSLIPTRGCSQPQVLQQDSVFWARDPHRKLVCQPASAAPSFHSSNTESRSAPCLDVLR